MLATLTDVADEVLALPASAGQQRFWVLDQLHPGDPSLNVAVRFGLTGRLDPAVLERSLNEVVRRHEILRASFRMLEGQVTQFVAPELHLPVPVVDLRANPAEAEHIAEIEAAAPFSLDRAPLLRAQLLQVADREHILLITIHHIVSDGWSIGILTDELGPLYEAFLDGRPSPLPPLAIQYADYTLWEQDNSDPALQSAAADYWTRQLAGLPQFELATDFPRHGGPGPGHIVSRLLPLPLTDRLRDLSQQHGTTLFMTMFAALGVLLHRYSGLNDLVVGSQVAGRNAVEVEPLIGPFINTLILRLNTEGDPTFSGLLRRAQTTISQAFEHQSLPIDQVAALLKLERRAERNLLFNINFIYQRDFVHPWEYGGVSMRPIPSKSPGAMYDLNLFLVERADGWRLSCEYNTALYRKDTVAAMLEHYETLLSEVVDSPDRTISDYRLLSLDQIAQLDAWNHTSVSYPRAQPVSQLIEAQAARTPNAPAVTCLGQSLTYAQLNARANQLARHLIQRGTTPVSLIGIALPRSLDMLTAVLAVLKTGAAYVPLDPSFPADRLAFMASDAGLFLQITPAWLTAVQAAVATQSAENLEPRATPQSLAYVIYTSGSTGIPKGVRIHQQALVNLLTSVVREPGIAPNDTLLAITTLSFDIAGLELLAPLVAGAHILLATRDQASDPAQLRGLLAANRATILQATPATWKMLIDADWTSSPGLKMLCGGEALTRELADALLARGGELWNLYGPTETTIWSAWKRIQAAEPVTVGGPAPNQTLYILDEHQNRIPIGVAGELYIGGDGVGQGYHNRPDLTAERFLPNPFDSGTLYRTGDRARWTPEGTVEILGRMDRQVKIRGFRIELGEVEAALAAVPGVRQAAVIVHADALAGYFEPLLNHSDVRQALQLRLPEYMVPTHLIPLASLPQTPNGKLDRNHLPAPDQVRGAALTPAAGAQADPEAGADPISDPIPDALEATLTGIWESVLPARPIRRTDNFFEIGGHSVLAARMFARMGKVLGKTLPLATLFQAPTIAKLAHLLRDSGWTPPWSSLVPIRVPSGATRQPFFFVHAIGGNVLNFAGFAGHLSPDLPVYGLQARGLDGKQAPHQSIPTMAADYIAEIRSIQPNGPYHIGGFSAGGIVAFEMARQLQAAGEQVSTLALLDSKIEGGAPTAQMWFLTLHFNLRYAFQIGFADFVQRKLHNWGMRLRIFASRHGLGNTPLNAEESFLRAIPHYHPEPYSGQAVLFRAKDEMVSYPDPNLGWGPLIQGGLSIEEIGGDHDTLLAEPHIGELARALDRILRKKANSFS